MWKSTIIGTALILAASTAAQRAVGEEYTCGQLESSARLFGDAVFIEESLTYCPNASVSSIDLAVIEQLKDLARSCAPQWPPFFTDIERRARVDASRRAQANLEDLCNTIDQTPR
jgi:hypothetical protein